MKNYSPQNLKLRQLKIKSATNRLWVVSIFQAALLMSIFYLSADTVFSIELKMYASSPASLESMAIKEPDQLPQSRVAKGNRDIITAWFAGPTDRYRHGILGDELEASRLLIETFEGKRLQVDLPFTRVFEDLEPRLVDVNGDNKDEIMVVESDSKLGASLALYGIVNGRLKRIASTPFLGKPKRWLNPLGVGDFDGDGQRDIALVATPHIGGILRLYSFKGSKLTLFAEYSGVSTHRIGSTELGLGRVISAVPRDRLLVPNQKRRAIILLEWARNEWQEITRVELSGYLESSLRSLGSARWLFRLENGKYYEIQLDE